MSQANVSPFVPPAKPGPYIADRSKFRNGGTLIVDTANLAINANVVNTDSLKAYGVPGSTNPAIAAISIATPLLYTSYLDAANVQQYRVAATIANDQIQLISSTLISAPLAVQQTLCVGQPQTAPPFSILTSPTIRLNGDTLANAYPFNGGGLVGYSSMYVPQPPFPSQGSTYDLNGGVVGGNAPLYQA